MIIKEADNNVSLIRENHMKKENKKQNDLSELQLSDDILEFLLESKKIMEKEKKRSIMEKLLGSYSKNIPIYIAFIIIVLLIIVGIIDLFFSPEYKCFTTLELWNILGPIITGILGYIFGKGQ